MKALFISFNQAYNDEIVMILEQHDQRGFTQWNETVGRGSVDGEPHLGNHAWPVMNISVITMVEDEKLPGILKDLKAKDEAYPELGLRAYAWVVTDFC